ncbi:HDOD domain-containing protein [Thiocystis violacea]|uniref:HDOD domain-containing protein n=1 Tax=Thiocystis violacea TaxID=13725 RepID=UPI0019078331|nr:HDOD domain-containing protein [Thiocystis violacea]
MSVLWNRLKSLLPGAVDDQAPEVAAAMTAVLDLHAFPGLSKSDVKTLLDAMSFVRLAAGQRLLERGETMDRICLVLNGCLHLKQASGIPLETFEPGDWIGDVELDVSEADHSTVIARTSTMLLAIRRQQIADLDEARQRYLRTRITASHLARLRRLRLEIEALSERQDLLADLLYASRTRKGVGFAQSPAVKLLFSKIKALPVSSITLLNKMLDERTTKNEIVELVTMDPSLTSTLLRAANTPLFGFRQKITHVGHAIVLMGHNIVYQIIMSESMRQSLPDTPFFNELHRRAIEVSRIAFTVSESLHAGRPAEVATLGLLCDIGLVVMELLKTYNAGLGLLFDDLDPAEMGAELLRGWQLPDVLCKSVQFSRHPEFAQPHRIPVEVRANVAALYLARCCYDDLHRIDDASPRLFAADYLSAIGYPDLTPERLLRDRVLPKLRAQRRHLPTSLAASIETALPT